MYLWHMTDDPVPSCLKTFKRGAVTGARRELTAVRPGVLLQSAERAAGSLAELGDGGFLSSDFELLQQVGRLSVQQVSQACAKPTQDRVYPPTVSPGVALCAQPDHGMLAGRAA